MESSHPGQFPTPTFRGRALTPASWRPGHPRRRGRLANRRRRQGIGKEIARQLAAAGLTVYVGSRDAGRGQRAVDEIGGNALLLIRAPGQGAQANSIAVLLRNVSRWTLGGDVAQVWVGGERANQVGQSLQAPERTGGFGFEVGGGGDPGATYPVVLDVLPNPLIGVEFG